VKNILLFIDDLSKNQGILLEIKTHGKVLEADGLKVKYVSFQQENELAKGLEGHYILRKKTNFFSKIYFLVKNVLTKRVDIAHIFGVSSINSITAILFCQLKKIPYVISPYSQITTYNLNHKIFFNNPDIKELLSNNEAYTNQRFKKNITPKIKQFFFRTIGYQLIKKAVAFQFLSNFEKDSFFRYYPKLKGSQYKIIPEINLVSGINIKDIFSYNSIGGIQTINIVYWGRLDYNLKGLAIILEALELLKNEGIDKVKVFFMGPSYQNGTQKLKQNIEAKKIEHLASIVEEKYWRGTKAPLANADYSILASRWDGFPRALRESIELETPVIVSPPTNFVDIIQKFQCGYFFHSAKELAEILINLPSDTEQFKSNCKKAAEYIAPSNQQKLRTSFYKEIIAKNEKERFIS